MAAFIFKNEPDDYSLQDLKRDGSVAWNGVRNYGARNRMKQAEEGDLVFYYHSGISKPAIVGTARISKAPYPDPTQYDEDSPYFDAKATEDEPRWWTVEIKFESEFDSPVTLDAMKDVEELADIEVLRQKRLSVSVVTPDEANWITNAGSADAP